MSHAPTVRVFVATYRRAHLLRRALGSLLAQTRTDWVAELHNDDPSDDLPRALVRSLGDPRIVLNQHDRNLGGTATFNLFFRECEEPYMAILEDDNWWEPEFLNDMINAMEGFPEVEVAWSNMHVWREEHDGSWTNLNRLAHDLGDDTVPIHWGHSKQAFGALHSNGSMLAKTRHAGSWKTPPVEFGVIEPFRERMFPHPMLYVSKPLVNFAQTINTHRGGDRETWGSMQVLLSASFALGAQMKEQPVNEMWRRARESNVFVAGTLIAASLQDKRLASLRALATVPELFRFVASSLRHPIESQRVAAASRRYPQLWEFLVQHTSARFESQKTSR